MRSGFVNTLPRKRPMPEKLFVLIRRDLSVQQQAVQAGHAVAEFLLRGPKSSWHNGTLVYLSVPDQERLRRWEDKLCDLEIPYTLFREPDLGNEITALAVTTQREKIFKSLQLAKFV